MRNNKRKKERGKFGKHSSAKAYTAGIFTFFLPIFFFDYFFIARVKLFVHVIRCRDRPIPGVPLSVLVIKIYTALRSYLLYIELNLPLSARNYLLAGDHLIR